MSWCLAAGPAQLQAGQWESPSQRVDRDGTIRSLYNVRDRARPGAPELAAREFLSSRNLLSPAQPAGLVTERSTSTSAGHHIRFAQTYAGLPVYGGGLTVSMTHSQQVTMVVNSTLQGIRVEIPASVLAPDEALATARRAVAADDRPLGVEDATQLMIYRAADGTDHVAYRTTVVRSSGDWEIFVDATSGAVLATRDQFVHNGPAVRGRGYAYRSDPLSAARQPYGAPGFADRNDAASDSLNAYRIPVDLDSLETEGGMIWLRGPACEITDIEAPADSAYRFASADALFFDRSQPEFEAVNVFYHMSLAAARLRELGIRWPKGARLRIDPHGCCGRDDSHYSPTGHWIAFGTGGVDDAEDADVLWHEFGHAIQYSLIPGWGGGECGALGEGFADYWAASYSRSLGEWTPADPQFNWLFNWDGHNTYWNGRITNDGRSYPFGPLGIHDAGQIWSSALVGILGELGRDVTDRIILQSFAYLGPGVTAADNAQAIVQADRDLFGGRHIPVLFYWLSTVKGFIPRIGDLGILVINDDPAGGEPQKSEKGAVDPAHSSSAQIMAEAIGQGAYSVEMTSFSALDTSRLSSYALVLLSGGMNPRPFDDQARRDALVRYVRNGGRVVVEGGEVGYYYRRDEQERDAAFRRTVLHAGAFISDAPDADLVGCSSGLFSEPNRLPSAIHFAGASSFAERDAMTADPSAAGTVSLGAWSGLPAAAGIIVGITPERSVSTVFLPFAVASIGDSAVSAALVQNVLSFAFGTVPTDVESPTGAFPTAYALDQNYPNPFNGRTVIGFRIPAAGAMAAGGTAASGTASEGMVKVSVFDLLGREVATLVNERMAPGSHTVSFDARGLSSGTYLYALDVNGSRLVRRMVLMK